VVKLRFLLDSNVISEPARPSPNPGILRKLREHQDKMAIASVVWHELLYGCERLPPSRKRRAIEDYLFGTVLAALPILPYDETAAKWHAAERAHLEARGKTPPFNDSQIAAIAKTNDLVLVTANRMHFEFFAGLQIEDWRE
jgi:tRNA(fMet)-specific endonuclease VapC